MASPTLHQPPDDAAARLRLATTFARIYSSGALIRACRARQMRHVFTGHQAAFALAEATLRSTSSRRGH
jgi:hypothetical protein